MRKLRKQLYAWGAALVLVSLAPLASSYAAADNEDVAELRRMLRELQTQNRELSRRLGALEAARQAPPRTKPAEAQERPIPAAIAATPAVGSPPVIPPPSDLSESAKKPLDQRVKELEIGWAAQESATRQIIQDSLSKTGSKINNYLSLSGAVEMTASRFGDFNQPCPLAATGCVNRTSTQQQLQLTTAELDFDIKLSDWVQGSLVLNYNNGSGAIFPTGNVILPNLNTGVDRFTLDRSHIVIGDFTRFPIAARFGLETLPFGTSTGVHRLDVLSISTPLTTEVFENRQTAAGFQFAWPTPPLRPPPAPIVVPPVQPLVIAPMVAQLARWLGYNPLPQLPVRRTPVRPPIDPPPFYGSILAYNSSAEIAPNQSSLFFSSTRTPIQEFNATLGFRTSGHCGVPYDQLRSSLVCPWTLDVHVDYDTSVFESTFLHGSYLPFLNQIGRIPGVAASAKATFGPFGLVGEVNTAINDASFLDALGIWRSIRPMTWQAALSYQFDWNPWITELGAQGNYVSVGYSGSQDMAGAIALIDGVRTRVGFVPQSRFFVTAGEWVMDGVRLSAEYSVNWDYPQSSGGTGLTAHGVFGQVQVNF